MKRYIFLLTVIVFLKPTFCQENIYSIFEYEFSFNKYSEVYDLYSRNKIPGSVYREYVLENPQFSPVELYKKFGLKYLNNNLFKDKTLYIDIRQLIKTDNYTTKNKNYLGNEFKHLTRLNIESGKLSLGGLVEKDIGEDNIFDNKKIYFQINKIGIFDYLILGSYRVKFGQGLSIYQCFGRFKGGDPIYPVKNRTNSIFGNNSYGEQYGYKGVAFKTKFSDYNFYLFYSNYNKDANLNDEGQVTSLYTSGYHRTFNESTKKDNLKEVSFGGRGEIYVRNIAKIGLNFVNTSYDKNFIKIYEDRQTFNFTGKKYKILTLDGDIFYNNYNMYFEIGVDNNFKKGIILGLLSDLENGNWGVLYRNFERGFVSLFGNTFSENQNYVKNEKGIYLGFKYRYKSLSVYSYIDVYKYLWRTYYNYMPVKGNDFLSKLRLKVYKNNYIILKCYLKSKQKNKKIENDIGIVQNSLVDYCRKLMRLEYRLKLKVLEFKIALDHVTYSEEGYQIRFTNHKFSAKGNMLENKIRLNLNKSLTIDLWNVFYFSNEDIVLFYKFEQDMPGYFYVNPFSGRGEKRYIMLQYNLSESFRLNLKVSQKREYGIEDMEVPEKLAYSLQFDYTM